MSIRQDNAQRLTYLGSKWGGLRIDLDLIPDGASVISAGLAHDISFDIELIQRRNCVITGVDPTRVSARTVWAFRLQNPRHWSNFHLLRRAVHGRSGLSINLGGPARTSLSPRGKPATTISLDDLVLSHPGAALIKLDIEGSEFPALEALETRLRAPQIAIGFHAWLNNETDQHPNAGVPAGLHTEADVLDAVDRIKAMGYRLVYEAGSEKNRLCTESLFIRDDFAAGYCDIDLRSATGTGAREPILKAS